MYFITSVKKAKIYKKVHLFLNCFKNVFLNSSAVVFGNK